MNERGTHPAIRYFGGRAQLTSRQLADLAGMPAQYGRNTIQRLIFQGHIASIRGTNPPVYVAIGAAAELEAPPPPVEQREHLTTVECAKRYVANSVFALARHG